MRQDSGSGQEIAPISSTKIGAEPINLVISDSTSVRSSRAPAHVTGVPKIAGLAAAERFANPVDLSPDVAHLDTGRASPAPRGPR